MRPPAEEPLPGDISTVVKAGNTVRRGTGPWTPAVHALLNHLEEVGFDGAPRVLGIDEQGREVLTYVPGDVLRTDDPRLQTDRALSEVGRLLRRYHDAVSGFELPDGVGWHSSGFTGPGTLVCHNDIAPKNTVFRRGHPAAFVDWDLASPAPPAWDVAHAAWQFVPLVDGAVEPDHLRRLQVLCDAYGLKDEDRAGFVEFVALRMETTASGIEKLAAEGVPAHRRLVEGGVPARIRVDKDWVERHARLLGDALL